MNPIQALEELHAVCEKAKLNGPHRDRVRAQAQALHKWIAEQLDTDKPKTDEPKKE